MKHIFAISAVVLCSLSGLSRPAYGQIYSWTDSNGVLVLANRRKDSNVYTSTASQGLTATVGLGPGTGLSLGPSPHLSASYEPLITQHASLQGVRPDLVRAVIQVESAFNPFAISRKGAMGLMQLMPGTAARFGVKNPFNPAENIRAGVTYLRQLLDHYNDNEQLALAAYNAGPGAVARHGNKVPPYRETQKYVHKITGMRKGTVRNAPGTQIYRVTDLVDGQPVVKYTNVKPDRGAYEAVSR